MIEAVIVAAGSGKRMGNVYKQFSLLSGKELFLYSVEKFFEYGADKVILVVPRQKISEVEQKVKEFAEKIKVVAGGEKRQDSVRNGFNETSGKIVLIHDAVRPFINIEFIDRVVKGVKKFGVCAPGIPVRDTLKIYKDDEILWTRSRTNLLQVQTPQGFKSEILKQIINLFDRYNFTDELAFAEKLNYDVRWVEGESSNIKVTYPSDMKLAEAIAEYAWGNKS